MNETSKKRLEMLADVLAAREAQSTDHSRRREYVKDRDAAQDADVRNNWWGAS